MRILPTIVLTLALSSGKAQPTLPRPFAVTELPAELREVSGLTAMDENTVACLQDETATLYLVDLRSGRILGRHPFAGPGDMEGITRVKDHLFALRSDGHVYRIGRQGDRFAATDQFDLILPYRNYEGLGYDPVDDRVLVAPKDSQKGGPELRDKREVFAFDPATLAVQQSPVLAFSVKHIIRAAQADGVDIPMRTTDKGRRIPDIKVRMSSITVEPATGHYFILSAVDQTLLVLDRKGSYVALYLLDARLLPKAEGITFLANGDMLIATEGKDAPPRLVRYAWGNR